MRKNPVKILRLRKDLFMLKRFRELIQNYNDTDCQADSDEEALLEVQDKYDEEKTRRLFRADRISQILSGAQYKEFNEARKNSFLLKSSRDLRLKMKTWLNVPNEIRLSIHTLTVLAILAHETIAKIVDMCILTRLNSENRTVDPFSRITSSGTSHSMLHLCPEVTQGRGCDGVKNITVPEINEAIRRYNTQSMKQLGQFRNNCWNQKIPYLAL
jgi:transcription initiation protein SPT3